MRFRIRVIIMLLLTVIALAAGIPCAAESDPADRLRDAADNIEIPEAAQPFLTESGLSASDPESLLTISPSEMLQTVLHTATDEAAAPLRLCGTLLALTVLTTVLSSLNDAAAHPSMKSLFDAVGTLLCVTAAASPLCTCLIRTADAFQTGRVFMGSYVPVFAAFIAAGGSVAGGAAYQIFVLFLTETVMQIAGGILFPLLQMAAALGIVDAVNPKLHLGCFVSGIHKGVTWLLGFLMALFSALLSVRSFAASAADSLAAKSLKLIASSAVPVIGGAVSDAYGTVQGSIRLLRNGVGGIGILVILWLVLPPMLSLILYRLVYWLMQFLAETAGASSMAKLYHNMLDILSAAFALLFCFAVMLIFSSAIMLLLLGN